MKCNICLSANFGPMGQRPVARCLRCGSLERTRLIWLLLEKQHISMGCKILHFAPEKCLYDKIRDLTNPEAYVTADFSPENFPFATGIRKMDLCSLGSEPSENYDFIIHSHVLEHTPCNIAYTLFHLHRMLKPMGKHIFCVPFVGRYYAEDFGPLTPEERRIRYGQEDHVRKFSSDDINLHLGKILNLPKQSEINKMFSIISLNEANIPIPSNDHYSSNTIFSLNKNDYRLF